MRLLTDVPSSFFTSSTENESDFLPSSFILVWTASFIDELIDIFMEERIIKQLVTTHVQVFSSFYLLHYQLNF